MGVIESFFLNFSGSHVPIWKLFDGHFNAKSVRNLHLDPKVLGLMVKKLVIPISTMGQLEMKIRMRIAIEYNVE